MCVGCQDQRVDLGQVAVALRVALVELDQQFRGLLARHVVELRLGDPASSRLEIEAAHGVDGEKRDGVGVLFGDDFDLYAPLGAQHPQVRLIRTIQGERGVVLLVDVARTLHPEPLHDVTLDVEAQYVAGVQSAPRRRCWRA